MKRKRKSPAKLPPEQPKPSLRLTDIQEFQKAFGPQWLAIIQSAPFREAMYLLNKEKLDSITNLSDEVIEKNSREILGDLRGHLQHENNLMSLHARVEGFPSEDIEEYFSPEQIAELEMVRQKFRELNKQTRYGR